MSRITMPPSEALAQLIAECKQLDASEVGERWNQFNGAIAVAEMVLRDAEARAKTLNEALYGVSDAFQAFEISYLSMNGFHTRKEIAAEWEKGKLCGEMFRAGILYAAPVAAQSAAVPASVPTGWKLVPKKPTAKMILAAEKADDEGFEAGRSHGASPYEIYEAMVAAAPLHESGSAAAVQEPLCTKWAVYFKGDSFGGKPGYMESWQLGDDAERALSYYGVTTIEKYEAREVYVYAAPAIAAPTEVERWQPIGTAPRDGTRFLGSYDGKVGFWHWQDDPQATGRPIGWRDSFIFVSREGEGPTHWMPIHRPPEAPCKS